jgi:hypothetical protein
MRVHPGGKGLEMGQDPLDCLVAPGPAPRGRQGLPEVLLKGPCQAGCPGEPLVGPFLGLQIAQQQAQVAALHLLRRRTGRHRMLKILRHPPSEAILSPHALWHQRPCILFVQCFGPRFTPLSRVFGLSIA